MVKFFPGVLVLLVFCAGCNRRQIPFRIQHLTERVAMRQLKKQSLLSKQPIARKSWVHVLLSKKSSSPVALQNSIGFSAQIAGLIFLKDSNGCIVEFISAGFSTRYDLSSSNSMG